MTVPVSATRPPGPRRAVDDDLQVYGLTLPTLADARQGLLDAFADDPTVVPDLWSGLLAAAGLSASATGGATGLDAIERLVDAFCRHADPVVALCGRALRIRVSTYTHLLAARRSMAQPRTTEDQS